ncbi:MAG TPA: divergent PAP2 family protein [Candidatus Dormibacteraeota bacterium]
MSYIAPALAAWAVAQVTKLVFYSYRRRRVDFRVLASMGGFPSSHSAMVIGLTTAIGRLNGLSSPLFALALIFSLVVMYDAAGVRRAAGQQAAVLNRMIDDFFQHRGLGEHRMRELLGHTPVEVFAGAAVGVAAGFAFTL